jgi:tetratricopeptide (TPR) repeat protein
VAAATLGMALGWTVHAARVPLEKREDYQAGLRASQLNLHDVAALKFERLLKAKDLNSAEEARLSERLVDALLRARLPEKAQVALTFFDVPDETYWRGQVELMQGKFREAETELKAYLKTGGKLAGYARLALGQAIVAQGRENTGRKEFKSLLLHPDPVIAERARLLSNESEALSDRAAIVLKRLGTTRGSPENEFVKACAFIEAGDGKQAEILLRRIIEALPAPENAQAAALKAASWVRLAEAYSLQRGRTNTAERTLLQFLDTTMSDAYIGQAFALLMRLGMDDDKLLKNLLGWCAKPENPERHAYAQFHTGQWYIEHGRVEEAIKVLEEFRVQHPGHPREGEVLRALMMLHGSVGDDDRVVELAKDWRNRFGSGGEDTLDFLTAMVLHSRSDYSGAAALFEQSAVAASDIVQSQRALYNAAICRLMDGNESGFEFCLAALQAPIAQPVSETGEKPPPLHPKNAEETAAQLLLERALHLAATRENGAEDALQEFIKDHPGHPRAIEAHIALAEICLLSLPARTKAAGAALDAAEKMPEVSDEWRERVDYTRVWWHEAAENSDGVIAQGQDFLARWPQSPRRDEVRMKVAQAYFRKEDYAKAMAQFMALAEEHGESPYAEVALFFAGRAAFMQGTEAGVEKAITLWEEVVAREGPLMREARLQQALAKRRQGKEEDALGQIETLLRDTPLTRTEERFSLLTERGELYALLARKDPKNLDAAMADFRTVISDPAATRLRRARCGVLLAQCLQQSGKTAESLEACYDVIESFFSAGGSPADESPVTPQGHTWFYRAGFMALDLLESKKEWAGAATLADRLAQAGGERASEAAQRATKLRLEHFLWNK